jgi:O-succinylbenzoic acid--CoA ligase
MPLYHVGGVTVILRSLLYGSAVFHLSNFDAWEAAHQLSKNNQVVAASLVPAMLKRLFKIEDFTTHDQFQAILLGGGAVSPDLLEKCFINNIPVITSYGMTETCAQVAANPLFSKPGNENRLQSAGRIFDSNEVEIRGQKNRPVEAGISGSVWLKGPQIFDGYFDETSKKIDAENWFSTADYGKLDENGWLTIEARRTDLIITGGENVSPREVEMALENMEGVKEAAVFGLPDEKWGQRVVAAVVMASPGNIEAEMLKSSLKKELPAFKIPKQFLFVDELPRTPNGKIKRSRLSRI